MANLGPAVPIDGPLPRPPRFTLVGAATLLDGIDPHWQVGVAQRRYPCGPASTWNPCSEGTTRVKVNAEANIAPLSDYNPFVVEKVITCTTRGPRDHEERVRAAFEAVQHWAVENEFWHGTLISGNPHLDDASATTISGAGAPGVGPVTAMGLLDNAIADSGEAGFIHASPLVISLWASNMLLTEDSNGSPIYRSPLGNTVVAGSGYGILGPSGNDPNGTAGTRKAWAFATGPVQILRGAVEVYPDNESAAIDRANNVITYRAERTYATLWDRCLQAAALIDPTATP